MARSDAAQAIRRLDEVIARVAGMLAAESVSEYQGASELTGVYDETGAIGGPRSFSVHKNSSPKEGVLQFGFPGYECGGASVAQNVVRPIAAARGWFL